MFIIYKPCLLIRRGTVYPSRVVANTGKGNIHPYHDPDVLVKSPCRTSLANSNLYSWYFYIIYSWISRRGTGSHQNDDLSSHGETYFVQMTFPFHWMLNFLKTNIWTLFNYIVNSLLHWTTNFHDHTGCFSLRYEVDDLVPSVLTQVSVAIWHH